MKNKIIILTLFFFPLFLFPKKTNLKTGLILSIFPDSSLKDYTSVPSLSSDNLYDLKLLSAGLSVTISNIFELSVSYKTCKSEIKTDGSSVSNRGISVEFGKNISFLSLFKNPGIHPEISAGIFGDFYFKKDDINGKIPYSLGFYASAKIFFKITGKTWLCAGVKHSSSFKNRMFYNDRNISIGSTSVFTGVFFENL